MPHQKISIPPTLKSIFRLYGKCFPSLLRLVLPLLVFAEVANLIAGHLKGPGWIALSMVAWGLTTLADIKALQLFLSRAGYRTSSLQPVSKSTFFFFLFVTSFIGIAFSLASFFLIVPALLIYSSAILAPAFILEQTHGSFEAIGESVDETKGNVWRIGIILLFIWTPFLILNVILGELLNSDNVVIQTASFLFGIGTDLLGLLSYAVTAIVYVALRSSTLTTG